MNSSLYDKKIEFPKDKRDYLAKCLSKVKNVHKDTKGYQRNVELQKQEDISYSQMKRIKNFFDSFKGNQNEPEYILNGGTLIRNWVNDELRKMRENPKMTKTNKMKTGMDNQFIKTHDKNHDNVRPSKKHKSTLQKYDTAVMESLRRINELISKI